MSYVVIQNADTGLWDVVNTTTDETVASGITNQAIAQETANSLAQAETATANTSTYGIPGQTIYDDGSSIQTFDDGSTIITDNEGTVSSTPSIPDPIETSPNTSGFLSQVGGFISRSASSAVDYARNIGPNLLNGVGSTASLLNPNLGRLAASGLNLGGSNTGGRTGDPTVNINTIAGTPKEKDWRIRISLPSQSPLLASPIFGKNTLIDKTNGVIFPYIPTVTITHNARYQEQALTHSNYKNYFYEGSDVAAITIAGEFTVQNVTEGQYLLDAIYFFRTCTKMFFGTQEKTDTAGNPPPIVFLDGYGQYYLPHVSCVITSFQHTMPDNVDYLEIPTNTGTTNNPNQNPTSSTGTVRLPTSSQLQVTLQPVYSRRNVYDNFSLNKFASGALLGNPGSKDTAGFL